MADQDADAGGAAVLKARDLARKRSADAIRAEAEAAAEALLERARTEAAALRAAAERTADEARAATAAAAEADARARREAAAVEAERTIAEARAEAQRMSRGASDERDRLIAEADAEARARAAAFLAQLEADAARDAAALEAELAGLCLDCVRQILDWTPDEERVAALCRRALDGVGRGGAAVLHVAPERVAEIGERLAGLEISVAARPGAPHDAMVLETRLGSIDLSVDAQLAAIAAALRGGASDG